MTPRSACAKSRGERLEVSLTAANISRGIKKVGKSKEVSVGGRIIEGGDGGDSHAGKGKIEREG